MFAKLHAKLGDFWWYSLMLFCACRAADVLNAFVGLWLVPKYVDPSELGAVMPLSHFAGFLTLPVSIFALTFMKELTVLATRKEYGKMKSFMRGVFIGTGIFLVIALIFTHFIFPPFLERIRIAEGSLCLLIIASAYTGAVAPIYINALQALKRFKTISFINIVCAPIRFIAMLTTMPFRALSGYFVGQAASPIFSIIASILALRKELSLPAKPYWTSAIFHRLLVLCICTAAYYIPANALGLIEQTVLRQRLPDIDSAAYYIVTRFSDIVSFVACTLSTVLFPFTACQSTKGKSTQMLVIKASVVMIVTGVIFALCFGIAGKPLLSIVPNGDKYAEYVWALPWLAIITTLTGIQTFHTNTEVSAGRFKFLKWWIPIHIVFAVGLLLIAGYGQFISCIPSSWSKFLTTNNITSLKAMLIWFTITTILKTLIALFELLKQQCHPTRN